MLDTQSNKQFSVKRFLYSLCMLNIETHLEPSQTSKLKLFAKIL